MGNPTCAAREPTLHDCAGAADKRSHTGSTLNADLDLLHPPGEALTAPAAAAAALQTRCHSSRPSPSPAGSSRHSQPPTLQLLVWCAAGELRR